MADRSIVIRLRAEIDEFRRRMNEAGNAIDRNAQNIDKLANTAGIMGVAMVGAAAMAVKAFADFDEGMSSVQAATHESAANMDSLRAAALKAGKDTKYSATEAAKGIEELAKAGIATTDILGGGLDGALTLAAAGAIGVGDAAEIAATAMTQFKLGGDKVTHVADLLAAGAGKAQGGVGDLGMALKQAGLVANSTGLSIEETTAGLAAFASAGLIGSDAGTSFKSMLQRLTPQSAEAKAKMDELGISAYDSQGNFIGLAKFAGNLQDSLKKLTPEQRNAAEAVIFGSDAVRAANILYDQGAAGIAEWTQKVDDSGYAAETAAIMMDNLKGDVEQLGGSIETALIGLGSTADGPLRSLVQSATDVVNALAEAPPAVQAVTMAIVGGGGLLLLGGAGIAKLVVGIRQTQVAMQGLGITAGKAAGAVAGIGLALGVGAILVMNWANSQAEAKRRADALAETLDKLTGATTDSSDAFIRDELVKSGAARAYKGLGGDVSDLSNAILGNADAMERVNALLDKADSENAWNTIFGPIEGMNESVNTVRDSVQGLSTALEDGTTDWQLNAEMTAGSADAQDAAKAATDATTDAIVEQVDALQELIDKQAEAAGKVLEVRDAQRQFQQAIDDASTSVQESIDALATQYEQQGMATDAARARAEAEVAASDKLDISTEAGRRNQEALDGIADSGWKLIDSLKASGASTDDLKASMAGTREEFVKAAEQLGLTEEQANDLANSLNLIPTSISMTAHADVADAMASASDLQAKYDKTPKTITTVFKAIGDGSFVTPSGGILRAAGGPVYGPGTSTSDSIPARLSTGEHVLTASDVVKAGGQSAIYRLRSAIQAGALRFAQGGAVDFSTLHAQRFATGGGVSTAVGGSVSGGSVEVVGMVNRGTVYVVDPDAYARSVAARTRDTLYAQGVMR